MILSLYKLKHGNCEMSKYFVYNETTLVYTINSSIFLGVLKCFEYPMRNFVVADMSELRTATQEDFDKFRVCSCNHL